MEKLDLKKALIRLMEVQRELYYIQDHCLELNEDAILEMSEMYTPLENVITRLKCAILEESRK